MVKVITPVSAHNSQLECDMYKHHSFLHPPPPSPSPLLPAPTHSLFGGVDLLHAGWLGKHHDALGLPKVLCHLLKSLPDLPRPPKGVLGVLEVAVLLPGLHKVVG